MKAREFQAFLGTMTGAPIGEVDKRTRPLREAGVIESGPRGPGAPDIEAVQATAMLLAMVSRRAVYSGEIFQIVSQLHAVPRVKGGREFLSGYQLGAAIASMISLNADWSEGLEVERIEIEENGKFAWLRLSGLNVLFTNDPTIREWVSDFPETYERQFASGAHRCFVIGGALLKQIALELADEDAPAEYAQA